MSQIKGYPRSVPVPQDAFTLIVAGFCHDAGWRGWEKMGTVLFPVVGAGPMMDGLAGGQEALWCLAAESAGDCWCLVLGNGACASPWAWQGSSLPCSPLPPKGPPVLGEWGCWAVPRGETEAHHTAWGQGV